jgi:hypothetical protein
VLLWARDGQLSLREVWKDGARAEGVLRAPDEEVRLT